VPARIVVIAIGTRHGRALPDDPRKAHRVLVQRGAIGVA
jgi:hypothetical protein